MSAEILREAAALMRGRAGNALSDPAMRTTWEAEVYDDGRAWINSHDGHALALHGYPSVAEHIASWHPVVALAVADWLHEQAIRWEENFAATQRPSRGVDEPPAINYGNPEAAALAADYHARFALDVARAYLNETA